MLVRRGDPMGRPFSLPGRCSIRFERCAVEPPTSVSSQGRAAAGSCVAGPGRKHTEGSEPRERRQIQEAFQASSSCRRSRGSCSLRAIAFRTLTGPATLLSHRFATLSGFARRHPAPPAHFFFASTGHFPLRNPSIAGKTIAGFSACGKCPVRSRTRIRASGIAEIHSRTCARGIASSSP